MNSSFFETLGHYVYAYFDPFSGECLYVGKGKGKRCLDHVNEKGYESDNCKILARNLVSDDVSKAIESLKINELKPRDNQVKGHHWENYVMADLSFLFKNYTDAQWNGTAAMMETLQEFPELLTSKLNTNSKPSAYELQSGMINSVYCGIKVQGSEILLFFQSDKGVKGLEVLEPQLNEAYIKEITNGELIPVPIDRKDRCGFACESMEIAVKELLKFL